MSGAASTGAERHRPVCYGRPVTIGYERRGEFSNVEVNALHAEAFRTRSLDEGEWNWRRLVAHRSLGWVVARDAGTFGGFVNVVGEGARARVDPGPHGRGRSGDVAAD